MQNSSTRLTVFLAMALALVVVLPDGVHGGVNRAKSSHNAAAKASHVSSHHGKSRGDNDDIRQKKVHLQLVSYSLNKRGHNVTVDQLQPYDTNNDGYLSFDELRMIPWKTFTS